MTAQLGTANMVALVSIASLVIDRLGSGALLVFSFFKILPNPQRGDVQERESAEKKLRILSWGMAIAFSVAVVILFKPIRVLAALNLNADPFFDGLLTAITLASGADFVRSVLGVKGAAEAPPESPKPLEVTGKLVVEEADKKTLGQAA